MLAFGWLFNIVERGRASYDRVSSLLSEKPEIKEAQHPVTNPPHGDLDVSIQSFSYDAHQLALKNIHFYLEKGHTLGIIGKTGAGRERNEFLERSTSADCFCPHHRAESQDFSVG
jgi:ATP-binding cassette, subfamily B, multidrug efflux pump